MAVRTIAEVTVTDETDIDHLVTWYLRSTSPTKPSAPQDGSAPPSPWTSSEPGYDSSLGTTYLYTVTQTVWGDGSLTYGDVQLSSAYEAAKAAYNEAANVRTYATTEFQRTDEAIALRATKVETVQMAQPNLAPFWSMAPTDAYDATANPNGYWDTNKASGTGTCVVEQLADGWARINFSNGGSGNTWLTIFEHCAWRHKAGDLKGSTKYTVMFEFRNVTKTGNVTCVGMTQHATSWSSMFIGTSEQGNVAVADGVQYHVGTTVADPASVTGSKCTTRTLITFPAGSSLDAEFRVSLYEGEYAGPYKPYTGDMLYATNSELRVTADGISSEVSKKVNGTEVISTINQSAETVKIQASKVEITGDAVFSAINNDTGTTKISGGKIDATSITIGQSQVTNLTTDLAKKVEQSDIDDAIDAIEVGGRNLLRYIVYNYADAAGVVGVNAAYRGMYCAIEGGETYTISRRTVEGNRFWIDWSEQEPESGVTLHNLSKNNEALKVTVDVPSEANWLFFYLSNQSDVINDGNIKVERGNKATDWTPAPEDVDADITAVQDNLNATRTWYATCPTASGTAAKVATITPATTDFALAAGVMVAVKFDAANGVANPTLDVNGTGAKAIKRYGTTAPSTSAATSWAAGSTVTLTYDGAYWQLNNWLNNNDNYYDREAYKAALAASGAISAGRIAVLGTDGKLKLLSASAFDIAGPVVYVGTAYTSAEATAGTTKTNNYTFWGTAFNLTNTHAIAGAAAGKPVYIVGTLSGKLFTPNSTVLTCTVPSSADGLVYMRLGIMSTAANAVLESQHPLYMYFNGAFQQCDPATADAAKTATNYISIDPTNGIRIASADPATATTYQHQTATETEFVVSGTSQLWMGTSGNVAGMRIGQASQGNVYASGDGYVDVRNSSTVMAHFGYGEGNTGSGTSTAPYYTLGTRKTTTTAFSTSSTYEVGDRVLYNSVEYVCHTAVTTAGDWTGTWNWWVAIGNYSVAEGKDVIACGAFSHAEGRNAITIGVQSHAEGGYGDFAYGYPTMAVGISSHAEGGGPISRSGDVVTGGGTQAIGSSSHAEGSGSVASNSYSHAEGYSSVASGIYSHAEGYRSVASGSGSHAQNSNTIAAGKAQTAIGMYNVEDTNNTYALIIGNGLPDYDRSNALTVDWSGNVDMGPRIHAVGIAGSDIGLMAECEDTGVQVRLIVGSGGTNHGVYSSKLAKWLVHGDASNVYLNGKNVSSVAKNRVFASPNGSTGEASFRALVAADLPTVTIAKGGTGVTERQESTVTVTTANATVYNNVNYCWHNGIVGSVQLAVDLKAALANGSTLAIGTVPSGYRPPHAVFGSLYTSGTVVTGNVYAMLKADGTITLNNRSGGNIGTNTNIYMSFTYAM